MFLDLVMSRRGISEAAAAVGVALADSDVSVSNAAVQASSLVMTVDVCSDTQHISTCCSTAKLSSQTVSS